MDQVTIRQTILEKVRQRGLDKTICPSEVARALGGSEWRSLMDEVRSVGLGLVEEGAIEMTQQGQVVNPNQARGPIRYRITQQEMERQDNF